MNKILGREREIKLLNRVLSSRKAEFLAIYGRRRIGKTYLVQKYFSKKGEYFECTGIKDGSMKDQLKNFVEAFQRKFNLKYTLAPPKSWREAFEMLTNGLEEIAASEKIIIFFDELPWLATRKSKFLQELDYFWNTRWSKAKNIKLIVCGSAASWILDNLINAKGGLHNRVTETIRLEPFTLAETQQYLHDLRIRWNHKQILEIYQVMGGVPFYLNKLDKNKSVAQNINDLCFARDGLLFSEFNRLFKSLFESYETNLKIVKILAKYRYGLSFKEIVRRAGKKAGGRFSDRLNELEAAGFIRKTIPYGKNKRDHRYSISDEYTMFYLNWIEKIVGKVPKANNYWVKLSSSPVWQSWAGFAFEMICHKHVDKIIAALGLGGVGCLVSDWRYVPQKGVAQKGAQIDLLLDRDDKAITICEIKYSQDQFILDKAYAGNLKNKLDVFQAQIKTNKQLFLAMITTQGFKRNSWSEDLVNDAVTLVQLF